MKGGKKQMDLKKIDPPDLVAMAVSSHVLPAAVPLEQGLANYSLLAESSPASVCVQPAS